MSPRPLAGASVALTGGARGIGRETAFLLAEAGARVAIGDLDAAGAERVAREVGGVALGTGLDVSDRDSFASFLETAETAHGPLEALVGNAGVLPLGRFLEEQPDTYERTVAVNLIGAIHGLSLALPGMVQRGRGRVILVASLMGRITVPGAAVYGATKHAVVALAETVRAELEGTGVEVVTINPAIVRTEASAGVPVGRPLPVVEPDEVARAILRACERGGDEVAVPSWAGPVVKASSAVPGVLMRPIRRALGDRRVLTDLDAERRQAYQESIKRSDS